MGINYSALAATAKRLIGQNGAKCVLVNPADGAGTYNVETKKYDKSSKRFDGVCVVTVYEDKLIDGTAILAGDRKVIAVLSGAPVQGVSLLEVYNKRTNALLDTYQVINSAEKNPDATTVIAATLQCRKL